MGVCLYCILNYCNNIPIEPRYRKAECKNILQMTSDALGPKKMHKACDTKFNGLPFYLLTIYFLLQSYFCRFELSMKKIKIKNNGK